MTVKSFITMVPGLGQVSEPACGFCSGIVSINEIVPRSKFIILSLTFADLLFLQ
jgi:hypothetical protein